MDKVTQKYIKDNYSYDQILKAGPKIERRKWSYDIRDTYLSNLLKVLECEHPDVPYEHVLLEVETEEYTYGDVFATGNAIVWYDHELTELERFKEGLKVLQKREQEKQDRLSQEERDRKELERLKKKLGEK